MPLKNLKLTEITVDPGIQVRAAVNAETVAAYAEALAAKEEFPPLLVFTDGTRFLLADGFHRLAAAKVAGLKKFPCDIRSGGKDEATWAALGANARHGRPMTNAEKANGITRALVLKPKASDRSIARLICVSHSTVGLHRAALNAAWSPGGRIDHLASKSIGSDPVTREGADGKKYPVPPKPVIVGVPPDIQNVDPPPAVTLAPPTEAVEPEESDGSDIPVDLPAVVHDRVGQPVPARMLDVFRRRNQFTEMMTAVSKIKTAVLKLIAEHDALAGHVSENRFRADVANLYATLKFARPHALCPYCRGEGCQACKDLGWLGQDLYDRAPASMKGGAR